MLSVLSLLCVTSGGTPAAAACISSNTLCAASMSDRDGGHSLYALVLLRLLRDEPSMAAYTLGGLAAPGVRRGAAAAAHCSRCGPASAVHPTRHPFQVD